MSSKFLCLRIFWPHSASTASDKKSQNFKCFSVQILSKFWWFSFDSEPIWLRAMKVCQIEYCWVCWVMHISPHLLPMVPNHHLQGCKTGILLSIVSIKEEILCVLKKKTWSNRDSYPALEKIDRLHNLKFVTIGRY